METIFKHFKVDELFKTDGMKDATIRDIRYCLDDMFLLLRVLDDFRDNYDAPVIITSSWRSVEYNKQCGGVPTSQHLLGQALDFKSNYPDTKRMILEFLRYIKISVFRKYVGQVVVYDTFVHIGLRTERFNRLHIIDKRTDKFYIV